SKCGLILGAEPEVEALSTPRGWSSVDREPGLGRNPGPGITISRMQPAAPEIERKRRIGDRIGPAADPASSFNDHEGDPCRCEPCGGADSGGSRTDDNDLESVCAATKHAGPLQINRPCQLRHNTHGTKQRERGLQMLGYSGDVCATPVAAVGELVITGWLDKARRFNTS